MLFDFKTKPIEPIKSSKEIPTRKDLYFPLDLLDEHKKRPFIRFSTKKAGSVCLFMPIGIQFGDGMSFNNLNLGSIKQAAVDAANRAYQGEGSLKSAISAATRELKDNTEGNIKEIANFQILKRAKDIGSLVTGSVTNSTQNLVFAGSTLRSYNFTFKLVSESSPDSYMIKEILDFFREYMYPIGEKLVLKFPEIFQIKFYNHGSEENKFIPGIYDCNLVSMTSSINPSTNLLHRDGSQIDTDISISFQEIKSLNRSDIQKLNSISHDKNIKAF